MRIGEGVVEICDSLEGVSFYFAEMLEVRFLCEEFLR
jgi:hypothetical protein